MTRTSATASPLYRNNVIDFCAYREANAMEMRRYVLVPVEEIAPPVVAPRPRRNHHNPVRATLIHTCLNLTVIAVTFMFTVQLLAVI